MSNVISFLECMGQDAAIRHASGQDLITALAQAQLDPASQEAILANDHWQLQALIGATKNVCCGVYPGKDDEEEDEEPQKDDDEIILRAADLSFA